MNNNNTDFILKIYIHHINIKNYIFSILNLNFLNNYKVHYSEYFHVPVEIDKFPMDHLPIVEQSLSLLSQIQEKSPSTLSKEFFNIDSNKSEPDKNSISLDAKMPSISDRCENIKNALSIDINIENYEKKKSYNHLQSKNKKDLVNNNINLNKEKIFEKSFNSQILSNISDLVPTDSTSSSYIACKKIEDLDSFEIDKLYDEENKTIELCDGTTVSSETNLVVNQTDAFVKNKNNFYNSFDENLINNSISCQNEKNKNTQEKSFFDEEHNDFFLTEKKRNIEVLDIHYKEKKNKNFFKLIAMSTLLFFDNND